MFVVLKELYLSNLDSGRIAAGYSWVSWRGCCPSYSHICHLVCYLFRSTWVG